MPWARFDDMSWPIPDKELSWRLRHTNSVENRFALAEIAEAYMDLIRCTQKKRHRVCAGIKNSEAWQTLEKEA